MVDHITFFKDLRHNLAKDILILAGPEQYPARAIVRTYAEHLGATPRTVWIAGRGIGEVIEEILRYTGAAMFERYVAWVRFLPTDKAVIRTTNTLLKHLSGVRGVVISVYEDAKRFSSLNSERVLLVNMRPLKQREFEAWVLKRFRVEGEKVPTLKKRPDLKAILLESLPTDLTEAELELKKLLLYSDQPTREALNLLWSVEDVRIYEISKRIQEGDRKGAVELVVKVQEAGGDPAKVLSQLVRDMTNLSYVKLNLPPPFVAKRYESYVRKALGTVAQRITAGELRDILEELKRAEFMFRTVLREGSRWAYLKALVWKMAGAFMEVPREQKVRRS